MQTFFDGPRDPRQNRTRTLTKPRKEGPVESATSSVGSGGVHTLTPSTLTNTFVGMIPGYDSSNTTQSGPGTESYSTAMDFFSFDNIYRGWGFAVAYLGSNQACSSGNSACAIWDFSLSVLDTILRNTSGIGTGSNSTFTANGTCPAEVNGNITVSDQPGTLTYLQNAVEILNTGGNDNGLCESGETCLYTPNFGAYQGHGTLEPCTFVNGLSVHRRYDVWLHH